MNTDLMNHPADVLGMPQVDDQLLLVRRCPHYETCSAVECPLDPLQGKRGPVEEEKCHARRATRLAIVAQAKAEGIDYPLLYGGLTYAETVRDKRSARARARWESMSEEERRRRTEGSPRQGKDASLRQGDQSIIRAQVGALTDLRIIGGIPVRPPSRYA